MSKFLIVLSLLILNISYIGVLCHRGPSDTPISTIEPPYEKTEHPFPPQLDLWGKNRTSYPTNAHWTNFVLEDGDLPGAPLPFVMHALADGPVLSYPHITCDSATCFAMPTLDFKASASEITESSSHYVADFDELSLTMQWSPSSSPKSRHYMRMNANANDGMNANANRGSRTRTAGRGNRSDHSRGHRSGDSASDLRSVEVNRSRYSARSGSSYSSAEDCSEIICGIPSDYLTVHAVYGSPYMTLKYGGLTPVFTSPNSIEKVNDQNSDKSFTGTRFSVTFNTGNRYIIYVLNGSITLDWEGNKLVSKSRYSGVIRVAVANTDDIEELLDEHVTPYPIAGKISTSFSGDNGEIVFDWITEGDGDDDDLLMLTLPHHRQCLENKDFLQPKWSSLKGDMLGILGSKWKMIEPLTKIEFRAPRGISQDKLDDVKAAIVDDLAEVPIPTDTYSFGKVSARYARLALIADEVGDTKSLDEYLSRLESSLTPWLSNSNENKLLYDTSWGGIISTFGRDDSGAEYGQGWYNDQHFHWGYYLYSSAVLAKFKPEWGNQYKEAVNALARAIANPSPDDEYFVTTRYKDWYVGHSWASGLFPFGDAKNQESTSESVNGYYGLYLWGLAINDEHIKNWGRLLLATEIRSSKLYWQIPSKEDSVYLPPFTDNTCVGIVWCTKVDYTTWFGNQVEYIHEIQQIPFTPISEELLGKEWIEVEYPDVASGLTREDPPIQEGWKGFIYMTQSIIDKEGAWNNAKGLTAYDNGNSKSNTLYFIATRD
ncbi:uncharacterized protein LOC126323934 [Schistocerca gregaria]|uniref:uncharacterized protein LOC126323934 n=1 Tax=Schistocerca gregaria TaxID=7010 RepID=UPI00211DC7CF|nr:uncharacterized protein LOC126323934 [Schistocerca gregaria]XP_049850816.1 uncharacterized protein LOC126323934 [Schistocerca gregaria]